MDSEYSLSQVSFNGIDLPTGSQDLESLLQINSQDLLNVELDSQENEEQSSTSAEASATLNDNDDCLEEMDSDVDDELLAAMDEVLTKDSCEAFQCSQCSKIFKKKFHLREHKKTKHQGRTFQCERCKRTFAQVGSRNRHKKTCTGLKNTDKDKTIQCERCKRTFAQVGSRNRHKKTCTGLKNTDKDKTIQCERCKRTFAQVASLNRHKKTCTGLKYTDKDKTIQCERCKRTFAQVASLNRHKKTCTGLKNTKNCRTYFCKKCGREFKNVGSYNRHTKTCMGSVHICSQCNKKCNTVKGLNRHLDSHKEQKRKNKEKQVLKSKETNDDHFVHNSQEAGPSHVQSERNSHNNLESSPLNARPDPVTNPSHSDQVEENEICYHCRKCPFTCSNKRDLYLHRMREHYQHGGALQTVPWGDNPAPWEREDDTVDERLQEVYQANEPLILQNHEFGPVENTYNFPVDNDLNVEQLMRYVDEIYRDQQYAFRLNLSFGVILQNRETGDYRYFTAYSNNVVLENPMYISRRPNLRGLYLKLRRMDILNELLHTRPDTKWVPVLLTNVLFYVTSTKYPVGVGNLPEYLMTRESIYPLVKNRNTGRPYDDHLCLFRCLALHNGYDIKSIDTPAKQYYQDWLKFSKSSKAFCGVSFEEFPEFERCFQINLEVYSLQENGVCISIYKSRGRQDTNLYINLYENHASYIKHFASFAKKFQCKTCERHFDYSTNLKRHEAVCDSKTKYVYPGGYFKSNQTVFQKLEHYNIDVPVTERTFPWFIVYDFEAMLEKVDQDQTPYLKWTRKHIPISVSVCSNVPGYRDPFCFINPDMDQLVKNMIGYMQTIACKVAELAKEKWGWVLDTLQNNDGNQNYNNCNDNQNEKRQKTANQRMMEEFKSYMNQIPVLGFNSARYDLNLIKKVVAKHLCLHQTESFVVKKNNSYICISTPELKFMDLMQFLAQGTSYAKFLKAYDIKEEKGFFPYEWLDEVAKLETTELPPHEAFYSTLKNKNITDEEYQYCQTVWLDNHMTTFHDFLKWYNNLDVGPFVAAVERLQEFYFKKDIDVLKTAISVPGVARQMLFKTAKNDGASFALFDKKNEDLYQTFKNNIVGGPSVVFCREAICGKSKIRGGKLCQKVIGLDSNALYLWALDQSFPVGPFIRRKFPDFKPEIRDKYMSAFHWMNFLNHNGANIQHLMNCGQEKRVGNYPVDGFDVTTNTIYQFQGCYFHGHSCPGTHGIKDKKWLEGRDASFKKTQETTNYLRQQGYNVIQMWECEFKEFCRQNHKIYELINKTRPEFYQRYKYKSVTEQQILEAVVNDQLFGAVEVDIEVPDQWPSYFTHPTLSPYQYFAEMSPLFCNTDVPFDIIGKHMQEHVENNNLSKAPRKLLVGGMKARQILLASALLKWYLEHGMVVTKIYQVVEYRSKACFQQFVREVSNARREGDIHKDKGIIADTMKLIGNSGYGSLIMDKTKHRNITYVEGENAASLKVNDPSFRKLICLDPVEQMYEVEMAKKKIKLDLPIQLGYFILQYAKLHMLSFYYDFMDKFINREDFEYVEMDTDSAYMAISAPCLDDIIKPELRLEYQNSLKGFCSDVEVKADGIHWFPRTCCAKHAKYDKRTPGLFKLEYEGDEMVGLCSKTYIIRKSVLKKPTNTLQVAHNILRKALKLKPKRLIHKPRRYSEYKFSSKGVNKRNITAPMASFRQVLKTGKSKTCINVGFRAKDNLIYSYSQMKRGFSYFYCKRVVLEDGIHTKPLDITLCPVPNNKCQRIDEGDNDEEVGDFDVLEALVGLL